MTARLTAARRRALRCARSSPAAARPTPSPARPTSSPCRRRRRSRSGARCTRRSCSEYGRYADEELQAYVSDLGQRIAAASHRPDLQYTFTVLDSEEVNAFALPGGYVYITRGIMAYLNSEAELAAVLGHEVGHVTARHAVRQQTGATAAGVGATLIGILTGSGDLANLANMAGTALVRGYGRDMELEADRIGAEYLVRLGYSPEAMIDVVRLLKNQEMLEVQIARQEGREPRVYHGVFSTHPDSDTRLQRGGGCGRQGGRPARRGQTAATRTCRRIDGLPLGPSREQGVVRGSRFYHGTLGMTVAFPTGWAVQNQPTKVVAVSSAEGRLPAGDRCAAAARRPAARVAAPQPGRACRCPAASRSRSTDCRATRRSPATSRLPWGNRGPARVAVLYYNGLAYLFTGGTPAHVGLRRQPTRCCMSSIKTFRRLRDNELRLAEPNRITLVKAAPGDPDRARSPPPRPSRSTRPSACGC